MNKLHRLHGRAFGFPERGQEGLSLVELMVGLAVGLAQPSLANAVSSAPGGGSSR